MASWALVLPDFEIRHWNDDNGPISRRFFREGRRHNPVNASDYIRYWALHEFGGIYLDNDVEVLRPFDMTRQAFLGFQRSDTPDNCINTAVLGAEAGHPFIARCLERLDNFVGEIWPVWTSCGLPTEELGLNKDAALLNIEHEAKGVTVYSKERFYPWWHDEAPNMGRVTERTFAIHHWARSWA